MYSLFCVTKATLIASSPLLRIDHSTDSSTTMLKTVAPIADTMITASAADLVPRVAIAASVPAGAITLVEGPSEAGHAAGAPYDVIMIEGGVQAVPEAVQEQLVEGGRLVTIGLADGPPGRALLLRRAGGTVTTMVDFDAHAAALPGFAPAPVFAF